jgi:hypothetical protein
MLTPGTPVFDRLLAERAGIGEGELRELRDVHARAGGYLRSAAARAAHARQAAPRRTQAEEEASRTVEPLETAERPPEDVRQSVPAAEPTARPERPAARKRQDAGKETAPVQTAAEAPAPRVTAMDPSQVAWRRLRRNWRAHLRRAESEGVHRFELDGAEALVERMAAFPGREGLAAEPRAELGEIVGQYRAHVEARDRVRVLLRDVHRHWLRYRSINIRAGQLDVERQELRSWPIWLDRNERLLRAGRAVLDDRATYGAHLDRIADGRERLLDAVSKMARFSEAYRTQSRSLDRGRTQGL